VSLQMVFAVIAGGMFVKLGPTVGAVFTLLLTEGLRVGIGNQMAGAMLGALTPGAVPAAPAVAAVPPAPGVGGAAASPLLEAGMGGGSAAVP
jgi:hypothetical protein